MFLPGCDRCGQCGCVCGTPPYAITVTFSELVNRVHSQHQALAFSACFGSGASGVAMSPGGEDPDDRGPLSGVLLLSGGSCYAVYGRVEPPVTIRGSGSGATFEAVLSEGEDECERAVWSLDSVTISGEGTGYSYGEELQINIAGVTTTAPVALVLTGREEPVLLASVAGGTGGVLEVTLVSNEDDPETWGVASVAVLNGGSGYANGASVAFTSDTATQVAAAVATITSSGGFPDPGDLEFFTNTASGSGATFTFTWVPNGIKYDLVVALDGGGTGYAEGEEFSWSLPTDLDAFSTWSVESVDGDGVILSITLFGSMPFAATGGGGAITGVTVTNAGQYFEDGGNPVSVEVTEPGAFYREDMNEPPYVADVEVNADAAGGTGAVITATVDDDVDSPTFGQITALSIASGGTNYLAWEWACANLSLLNDVPFILRANEPVKLVTAHVESCTGSGACITIDAVGEDEGTVYDGGPTPIRQVTLVDGGEGYARLGREEPQWTDLPYGTTLTPTWGEPVAGECGLDVWPIESVAVSGTTVPPIADRYVYSPTVTGVEKVEEPARLIIHTRVEPTVTATVPGGSGASLSVVLEQSSTLPRTWSVASVTGGGGNDYTQGASVVFTTPPVSGVPTLGINVLSEASARVTVGEGGAITGVTVLQGGLYYDASGQVQEVEVARPGLYYRENAALTPHVDATVVITQLTGSSGSGAEIAVVVDDDTSSPTFGEITSATVSEPGSGYTLLGGPQNCSWSGGCPSGQYLAVGASFQGKGRPYRITLSGVAEGPVAYLLMFEATEGVADCGDLPGTATLLYGAESGSAAVVAGGTSDEEYADCPDPGCECLLDPETPVTVTSGCPCNNGNISGGGTVGDFVMDECEFIVNGQTYTATPSVSIGCCENACNEAGECRQYIRATVSSYIYEDGQVGTILGDSGCVEATVVDGVLSATLQVVADKVFGGVPGGQCTVTVEIG